MSDLKRLLNDLRVVDLRLELEKRNLDKSGVRGVLIQRLSKALEEDGHDPATYCFDSDGAVDKSTPTKRNTRAESAVDPDSEDTPAMEDMIVQDDVGDDEETAQPGALQPCDKPQQTTGEKSGGNKSKKLNNKRDCKDEPEATEAKKKCLDKEDKTETNIDADDSINLDLGEDELLEETDNAAKAKKDDAASGDGMEATGTETAAEQAAGAPDATATDDQQVNDEAPATSNGEEKVDGENKDETDKDADVEGEAEKKEKKDETKEGGARNLWVSGLSGDTRAKDLKQLCSKHGKVIGAKVVTNARTPGSRCYGYVTMASAQDAECCIKNLHRTELHGRIIFVEKAKSESESSSRRQTSRSDRRTSKDRKDDTKDNEEGKDGETMKDGDASEANSHRSSSRTREKSQRSDKDRARRSTRSRERRRSPREKERDVARAIERSRATREDRRRRAAEEALRERERRQRQEKHRLELERDKLRAEREKIEREKNELLRLERERHRLEREKLELERLELKRAQMRLEEERRKRSYESSGAYRKPAASPPPEPAYERDQRHKRAPPPLTSSRGQFEAPPPPRFDVAATYDKRDRDYKRDYPPRHVSSGTIKYSSNSASNDDARQPMPPGTRPKEPSRSYEARDSRPYRPSSPGKPEPRSWSASNRYPDGAPPIKGSGSGSGGGDAWAGGEPRYGGGGSSGGAYEPRYPPTYQPPPPGASYPDRYAPPAREYRKY